MCYFFASKLAKNSLSGHLGGHLGGQNQLINLIIERYVHTFKSNRYLNIYE